MFRPTQSPLVLLSSSGSGSGLLYHLPKACTQMYDSTVANTIRHAITAVLTGRVAPRSLKLKAGLDGFSGGDGSGAILGRGL